jgi:hypothetical protein
VYVALTALLLAGVTVVLSGWVASSMTAGLFSPVWPGARVAGSRRLGGDLYAVGVEREVSGDLCDCVVWLGVEPGGVASVSSGRVIV